MAPSAKPKPVKRSMGSCSAPSQPGLRSALNCSSTAPQRWLSRITLAPVIDGLQIATLFFFTVLPYAVAVLVPIWRASVTDPDAVMRA